MPPYGVILAAGGNPDRGARAITSIATFPACNSGYPASPSMTARWLSLPSYLANQGSIFVNRQAD